MDGKPCTRPRGSSYLTVYASQVLLLPVIFKRLAEKTFYLFGAVNFATIPIVWALYPESNQRTLEEMDLLFASNSWWNWDAEKTYARLREENPELVQATQRGNSIIDPETGLKHRIGSRGPSLIPQGSEASDSDGNNKIGTQR